MLILISKYNNVSIAGFNKENTVGRPIDFSIFSEMLK